MKSIWFALPVLVVASCALAGVNTGTTAAAAGGGTVSGVASGVSCGVDPNTGVTLCLGITICPSLTIDAETFPACGFRISGSALDVECVCGGQLCPLGAATSCTAVAALLAAQSEGTVCAQTNGTQCAEIGVMTGTSAASTSSGSGTCDTVCRDECNNDPTCILACGC